MVYIFYLCSKYDIYDKCNMRTQSIARYIKIITVLLFTCQWIYAEQFRFIHYEVENGLSSNTVRSITQDSRGFMWFGTENGLNRFDGYNFKIFKNIVGDSTSIGNNYIYSLLEDSGQTLWIGTDEGVYIYNPKLEQFSYFAAETDKGVRIKSNITTIAEAADGNIWFSSQAQGVFCFNKQTQQLKQYVSDPDSDKTVNSDIIFYLHIDKQGSIWAAPQQNKGLINRYDPATDRFVTHQITKPNGEPCSLRIYAIEDGDDDNLWIGTWSHGICQLNKKTMKAQSYLEPGTPNGISHVHYIAEYKPGILLVGSDDGLAYFNTRTKKVEIMTATELKNSSLSNKFIYPIYKDREGGIWVGTYYGGVNYTGPIKGMINGYTHSDYSNSVGGNIISCFCEDPSGNIWIGSDDGGLSYFDTKNKSFKNYLPDPARNSLSYHNIHALFMDGDDLWIGTYSGDLNILNTRTGKFSSFRSGTEKIPADISSVYSIHKDKQNNIWIGTMQSIMRYDRANNNFIRMKETGTTTSCILKDPDGSMWFGTLGKGLLRFDPQTEAWEVFSFSPDSINTLSSNQINSLCLDDKQQLWVATDNGICRYDKATGSFVRVPLSISQAAVTGVVFTHGYLWISTINGLISYSPETGEQRIFYKSDGLQSDQYGVNAVLLASSGLLYLGTTNGFCELDPRTISLNGYIPPVVITNLQVFNKDVNIEKAGILPQSITCIKEIELSYKYNVFSIEYVGLSYSVPEKNQYKYKLEGFDKDWNSVGNQRKATYTNLPAGKYTFHVMAANNDGVWNEEATTLDIIIHPPFWRTSFAYFLYIVSILSLICYIIYAMKQRTEKRHKERMLQLSVEKEKELHDAKINFFTLIAHEIRTPVSLIIGPLEKIMETSSSFPVTVQDSLKIINRNSQRLLSLVNQLLDFRKAEQGAFIINFSRQNMHELLQNLYDRFKPMIEQKGMSISFDMPDKDITAIIDSEAITKVISNLLTNATKYANSRIAISCEANGQSVVIKVTDDGRGISEKEQKNIFLPFYQVAKSHKPGTGLGLSLAKSLVDAHHGMIEVESGTDRGSTFTVTIPLEQPDTVVSDSPRENNVAVMLPDEEPVAEDTTKQSPASSSRPTLLIVEDNTDMRSFLHDSFTDTYNIVLAENGREGLDQLKKQPADLIISDVMMPVMDGYTFAKEVKENLSYSHIPLVLLTAKTDNMSKVTGIKSGADAYVEKPFSTQVLRAQIENLLESRKKLRKKFSEMPFVPLDSVAVNKADEQFLSKMNEIIEKNISNVDFSIDVLAEQLCISRSGLFAKIKTLVEMTPNELIQLVRLKKAAELLATQKYRINEICYQVGFNNPSYFSKCFQKQFGVLPKDFMNKKN